MILITKLMLTWLILEVGPSVFYTEVLPRHCLSLVLQKHYIDIVCYLCFQFSGCICNSESQKLSYKCHMPLGGQEETEEDI